MLSPELRHKESVAAEHLRQDGHHRLCQCAAQFRIYRLGDKLRMFLQKRLCHILIFFFENGTGGILQDTIRLDIPGTVFQDRQL